MQQLWKAAKEVGGEKRSEMQESEVILLMEHVELEIHIHDKKTLIRQMFDGLRKGWPVHHYHNEDGLFKRTENAPIWTYYCGQIQGLTCESNLMLLHFFSFTFCQCPSILFIPKIHRVHYHFIKFALVLSSDRNVLSLNLFIVASPSLRLQAES